MNDDPVGGWNTNPGAWAAVPVAGWGWAFVPVSTNAKQFDAGATKIPAADAANLRDIFGLPPEPPAEPTPEAEPVRRIKFREFL